MENEQDYLEQEFIQGQKAVCEKYSADFVAAPFNEFVGVALKSFDKFEMPINGLRHPITKGLSTNWYIWAGEYSEADDFFQAVHVGHLIEICPKAIRYLGLPPGWRFLFDNHYEDVWYDETLLSI